MSNQNPAVFVFYPSNLGHDLKEGYVVAYAPYIDGKKTNPETWPTYTEEINGIPQFEVGPLTKGRQAQLQADGQKLKGLSLLKVLDIVSKKHLLTHGNFFTKPGQRVWRIFPVSMLVALQSEYDLGQMTVETESEEIKELRKIRLEEDLAKQESEEDKAYAVDYWGRLPPKHVVFLSLYKTYSIKQIDRLMDSDKWHILESEFVSIANAIRKRQRKQRKAALKQKNT